MAFQNSLYPFTTSDIMCWQRYVFSCPSGFAWAPVLEMLAENYTNSARRDIRQVRALRDVQLMRPELQLSFRE